MFIKESVTTCPRALSSTQPCFCSVFVIFLAVKYRLCTLKVCVVPSRTDNITCHIIFNKYVMGNGLDKNASQNEEERVSTNSYTTVTEKFITLDKAYFLIRLVS